MKPKGKIGNPRNYASKPNDEYVKDPRTGTYHPNTAFKGKKKGSGAGASGKGAKKSLSSPKPLRRPSALVHPNTMWASPENFTMEAVADRNRAAKAMQEHRQGRLDDVLTSREFQKANGRPGWPGDRKMPKLFDTLDVPGESEEESREWKNLFNARLLAQAIGDEGSAKSIAHCISKGRGGSFPDDEVWYERRDMRDEIAKRSPGHGANLAVIAEGLTRNHNKADYDPADVDIIATSAGSVASAHDLGNRNARPYHYEMEDDIYVSADGGEFARAVDGRGNMITDPYELNWEEF